MIGMMITTTTIIHRPHIITTTTTITIHRPRPNRNQCQNRTIPPPPNRHQSLSIMQNPPLSAGHTRGLHTAPRMRRIEKGNAPRTVLNNNSIHFNLTQNKYYDKKIHLNHTSAAGTELRHC